ncbi:MAG: methionine--tRNA ligase [bacterium]
MRKTKKADRFLVTSALPYANGPLHLGHIAGAYLPADIYVRFLKLNKKDVIYICGSDEHGVPITVKAEVKGVSPQEIVDYYHQLNKKSFKQLGISFDNYSRTSLPLHHDTAQEFFNILYKKGRFIVKEEEQFYSETSKRFLPDRYVEGICPFCGYDKARGDQCEKCGKWLKTGELKEPKSKIDNSIPVLKKTKHWYFPMGQLADSWKKWFEKKKWKENVYNYCMGWYNEGLGDRPITRDLNWGVEVPLEGAEGKVLYVWFDAPVGYISSTKQWAENIGQPEKWKDYWCDSDTKLIHFIGKDNIVFHAILFPMMLAEVGGFILPEAIPANEYLTIEGRKISTSQNYAVWLKDYLEILPPDPLRYTLAINTPETKDTDFSWTQFQSRNNDELADILGNFINRTLTFVIQNWEGKVPFRNDLDQMDRTMLQDIREKHQKLTQHLENFQIRSSTRILMDICRAANKYFNDKAPWKTRKSNPLICQTTLNICVHIARILSTVMEPFIPFSAAKLRKMLNIQKTIPWKEVIDSEFSPGFKLGKPEILFTKIEDEVIEKERNKLIGEEKTMDKEKPKEQSELISIDYLKKVDLRTAKVIQAEKVENTDKLLKLYIELGGDKRQLVAGLAQKYTPEQITGKTIIIAANLEPATIKGVKSQGMLLAAVEDGKPVLLTTDGDVSTGVKIS